MTPSPATPASTSPVSGPRSSARRRSASGVRAVCRGWRYRTATRRSATSSSAGAARPASPCASTPWATSSRAAPAAIVRCRRWCSGAISTPSSTAARVRRHRRRPRGARWCARSTSSAHDAASAGDRELDQRGGRALLAADGGLGHLAQAPIRSTSASAAATTTAAPSAGLRASATSARRSRRRMPSMPISSSTSSRGRSSTARASR